MNLIKELLIFVIRLPYYITQFLRGLRLFSESYEGLLKAWENNEKIYQETDLEKFKTTNEATDFVVTNRNTALELIREHEKMFNQLFSIFVSTIALIISILALIVSIKK